MVIGAVHLTLFHHRFLVLIVIARGGSGGDIKFRRQKYLVLGAGQNSTIKRRLLLDGAQAFPS